MTSNLSNVLWIGGAPKSGKTALAQALAAKHGPVLYACDHADRWPFMLEELTALSARGRSVLAEGVGLMPALVMPILPDPRQALWLACDPASKRAMSERDRLLAEEIETQALRHGGRLLYAGEDGPASLLARAEAWWRPFLVHGS